MKKLIIRIICLMLIGPLYAQVGVSTSVAPVQNATPKGKKTISEIDKELKQTRDIETLNNLINQLENAVPETENDIIILSKISENFPEPGRRCKLQTKIDPLKAKL